MKENKNKILVAIIILLLLSNVCFISFIVYDKINNKDDNEQKDEVKEENKDDEKEKEQKVNLKVSETEAKKIYHDILHDGNEKITTDGFTFFQSYYKDKKVVYTQDIEFGDIMANLYYKLPNDKIEHSFKYLSNGTYQQLNKFLISDIKSIYKFYFGEKAEWTNFETGYPLGNCNISGDYYDCKLEDEGFSDVIDGNNLLTAFDKYETDTKILYVYEKAIYYYDGTWHDEESGFYTSYVDYNLEKEVVELKGKDPEVLLDEQYRDKFLTYKHTFKQNSDGTFYLYSTEPVTK